MIRFRVGWVACDDAGPHGLAFQNIRGRFEDLASPARDLMDWLDEQEINHVCQWERAVLTTRMDGTPVTYLHRAFVAFPAAKDAVLTRLMFPNAEVLASPDDETALAKQDCIVARAKHLAD